MTGPRLTRGDRDRSYKVQLWALGEEKRICGMATSEWRERADSIWDNCYGDLPQHQQPTKPSGGAR